MKKLLFCVALAVGLAGCASLDKGKQVKLHGLIMDADGNGISDYKVIQGEKLVGMSNDSGYFDVDAVYGKGIQFILEKENWEKVELTEEYPDFNKLHVFKVRSVDSVCNEIEEKLDVRDYGKINTIIDSLQPEMAGNPRIKYLKALALYKQEKYSQALEVLDDEVFSELGEVGARELMIMLEKIIGGKNG